MRFKLKLSVIPSNQNIKIIPLNYQYETSSWIYKVVNYGNHDFSEWLHNQGYSIENKKFKLFTFSNFIIPKFRIEKDRMIILSDEICIYISFFPIEIIENFVKGVFINQEFSIGDKISRVAFKVNSIEKIAEPEFSNQMKFKCLSPMVVSELFEGQKYAKYLSPDNENYSKLLIQNLINKTNSFSKHKNEKDSIFDVNEIKFSPSANVKSRLITVKTDTENESKIRGFQFDFEIIAPPELLKIGYYAGFGEKNSMGFGCCEII